MKIGIICAMDEECEYFLQNINVSQTKTVGKSVFYSGTTADGKEVVLSRSGIGRSNAASVCALMIALYEVDYVINCGIAGALGANLHIGDIVFSTDVAYHDVDFSVFGYKKGQMAGEPERFNASSELLAKAEIASQTISELRTKVKKGLIVSGDQFINDKAVKNEILNNFPDAQATECEGAPIAHVATNFNVPFIVIRSLSDNADENEVSTYEFNVKSASENSAKLVLAMIKML